MTPIQNLADNLAALGRYEDTYMVHAAEGETVVPRDVLDANPILKTALFAQMRSMGIENPDRYVVGSGLNSVNPITGQPEFFFKKIKRLVKKIAAPVGGTIGFALAGPAGAAIGSGLRHLAGRHAAGPGTAGVCAYPAERVREPVRYHQRSAGHLQHGSRQAGAGRPALRPAGNPERSGPYAGHPRAGERAGAGIAGG